MNDTRRNTVRMVFGILILSAVTSLAQRPHLSVYAWTYQLQKIDINALSANKSFDLAVIDYSVDGTAGKKFSPSEIARIQQGGKKAIAYISIGEAEDYRSYWKPGWLSSPPSWLGPENPQWLHNYKVRFWYQEWQQIIFNYIKEIYDQGFDGIYCDIIDGYYYWRNDKPEEPKADSLMMQFVLNIRDFIQTLGTRTFYIIPQNGESILHESNVSNELRKKFFDAIDAIGVEDVFFRGSKNENNAYNPETSRFSNLQEFQDNGNKVLLSFNLN